MTNGFAVLREALRLCRRRSGLWLTAGLLALPMAAVSAASGALGRWQLIPPSWRDGWSADVSSLVLGIVQLMVLTITGGVLTLAIAREVVGRPAAPGAAWREGLGRIRPAVTSMLAFLVPMMGWLLAFLLPTYLARAILDDHTPWLASAVGRLGTAAALMFLSVRFASMTVVAMVERVGGFDALGRSLRLQAGRVGLVAGAVLPVEAVCHGLGLVAERLPGGLAGDLLIWALLPVETAVAVLLYVRLRAERGGDEAAKLNGDLAS